LDSTLSFRIMFAFLCLLVNVANAGLFKGLTSLLHRDDLKPSNYSEATAKANLYFAYGAYCPEANLEKWNCKWCKEHTDFEIHSVIETGYVQWHLQAFMGYDPSGDQIVVSFRGSHNFLNWVDDFQVWQKEYPGIPGAYVHEGFYNAWQDLSSKGMLKDYQELVAKYPGKKTLSTGHSLGAAVASIAALDLANSSDSTGAGEVEVYTYGCPRWANAVLAKAFMERVDVNWRVVNVHDMVPTIPEQKHPSVKSPYHHTGTEVHYTEITPKLKYEICNGSGEDIRCKYVVPSADDHLHYMGEYESCDD